MLTLLFTGTPKEQMAYTNSLVVFQAVIRAMEPDQVTKEGARLVCLLNAMLAGRPGSAAEHQEHALDVGLLLAHTLARTAKRQIDLDCSSHLVRVTASPQDGDNVTQTLVVAGSSSNSSAQAFTDASADGARDEFTAVHVPECTRARIWLVTWPRGVMFPATTYDYAVASRVISVGAECDDQNSNATIQVSIPLLQREVAHVQHACGVWDGKAFVRTGATVMGANASHVTCHVHSSRAQVAVLLLAEDERGRRVLQSLPSSSPMTLHAMELPKGRGATCLTLGYIVVVLFAALYFWSFTADEAMWREIARHVHNKFGEERYKRAVDYLMIKALFKSRLAVRAKPWMSRYVHTFLFLRMPSRCLDLCCDLMWTTARVPQLYITEPHRSRLYRIFHIAKTEHLVGGMLWRQNFSAFTRPRRVACLFVGVCGSFAANALLLGPGGMPPTWRIFSGLVSSMLLVPAFAVFCLVFRGIHTMKTSRMHARRHGRRVLQSVLLKAAAGYIKRKDRVSSAKRPPLPPESTKPEFVRKVSNEVRRAKPLSWLSTTCSCA
jgi:hypothetical protein